MKSDNKLSYFEKNGTHRVGDWLRKIGKSQIFESAINIATNGSTGVLNVLKDVLFESKELKQHELNHALELLQFDLKEQEELTKRWSSDMSSDSFLSKNVRPIILIYSWVLITVMILFSNDIEIAYITMVQMLALAVNGAYFGSRAYNKAQTIKFKN